MVLSGHHTTPLYNIFGHTNAVSMIHVLYHNGFPVSLCTYSVQMSISF